MLRTDGTLSGAIWIHLSSASLQRIQPLISFTAPSSSAMCPDSDHVFLSLIFFSVYLGVLSGYHRAGDWVCSELKPQPTHSSQQRNHDLESAKSAFGLSVWQGDQVLENPRVSDIVESSQHYFPWRKSKQKKYIPLPASPFACL